MRIFNAEPLGYSPKARSELERLGEVIEADVGREELLRQVSDVDVLIVRLRNRIDAELFERASRLKAVVTATTGLNHIDLEAARRHGVEILSLQGEIAFLRDVTATAELAWGLLLCLYRNICPAHAHVVSGGWQRDAFKGRELKNKTLGIVGFGRLGRMMADYARIFRMKVMAADPYVFDYPEWVRPASLTDVLRQADAVTLHVALTPENQGLIGEREFEWMQRGAVFINTSRGELVNETALLDALQSGHLAGAALDVLAGEMPMEGRWISVHPLRAYAEAHGNLILTPHIGGATYDSMESTELFMVRKLKAFLSGQA